MLRRNQRLSIIQSLSLELCRYGLALLVSISLNLLVCLGAGQPPRQKAQQVQHLEAGKRYNRELKGGQSDFYLIYLEIDQYLNVILDQRGIDIFVTLFGPSGEKLTDADNSKSTEREKHILLLAERAGTYRLQIRPARNDAAKGYYELRIEQLRAATREEKSRATAQKIYAEGQQLHAQGTSESLREAIKKYEAALQIQQNINDHKEAAETLNYLGDISLNLGEVNISLDYNNRALSLHRLVGNQRGEAASLGNIGVGYRSLGEMEKALDYYNKALRIWRAIGSKKEETVMINNIGAAYDNIGEKEKALEYYNQALPMKRAIKDYDGEAATLNNLGLVYDSLGEKQRALDYYNRALTLRRLVKDRRGEAATLTSIGWVYDSLNQKQRALDYYNQALPLWQMTGYRRGESISLTSMGWVYDSLGEKQKALDYYNKALPLARAIGDRRAEAVTLTSIGWTYYSLGDKGKARDYYDQAIPLHQAVGDRGGNAMALYRLAQVERDQGNFIKSHEKITAALKIVEDLRLKISVQELRASYFAGVQDYYSFDIDLLMQLHRMDPSKGHAAAALQANESARARSLLEMLAEPHVEASISVPPALLDRERALQRDLNTKAERQMLLLGGKHTSEQAAAAAAEIDLIESEHEQVKAQIRSSKLRFSALIQPVPLSLQEIQQQVLDPDTLLLEYALGKERSYLWVVSQTSINSYELPQRSDIEKVARRVYELMTEGNPALKVATNAVREQPVGVEAQYWGMASDLSEMLLAPARSLLGTKRLVIVTQGTLQYLPFAALPVPSDARPPAHNYDSAEETINRNRPSVSKVPLIVEHEIISLPSASALAVIRRDLAGRKLAPKTIAVLADPVFDKDDSRTKPGAEGQKANHRGVNRREVKSAITTDEATDVKAAVKRFRLMNNSGRIPRLPFTRQEAKLILKLVPETESKLALDFEANKALAMSSELAQYRIIHFATHALLNNERPQLSGIVLSLIDQNGRPRNGFLRLHEIYNLHLPVELVILSACQTGLGKDVNGEGLIGLTRGFMYAGAARVVASLWRVDDSATAELMKHFHQAMLGKDRLSPAAALRDAQVAMWKQRRWQAPYFWAGFVLQGEWR